MKIGVRTLSFIICCLAISATGWAAGKKSVQVRKGQMRQQPSFLAQVIKDLAYGERVEVISKNPPWFEIKDATGSTGWMHTSALTSKRIKLRRDNKSGKSQATSDEIALAGKGFTKEMESEINTSNPALDYLWVNHMEQIVISTSEIEQFLRQGGIQLTQGGV